MPPLSKTLPTRHTTFELPMSKIAAGFMLILRKVTYIIAKESKSRNIFFDPNTDVMKILQPIVAKMYHFGCLDQYGTDSLAFFGQAL